MENGRAEFIERTRFESGIERILFTEEQIDARIREVAAEISRRYAGRTLTLIGQVVIFCNNQKRPLLAGAGLDAESVRLMKLVVREHTEAICRAALSAGP